MLGGMLTAGAFTAAVRQLVLTYYATIAEHKPGKDKVLRILLLPVVLLVGLVLCIGLSIGAAAILQNAR